MIHIQLVHEFGSMLFGNKKSTFNIDYELLLFHFYCMYLLLSFFEDQLATQLGKLITVAKGLHH